MASLQKRKRASGTAWLVQFTLKNKRKSLFLDTNYSKATATDVKNVVEKCIASIESDTPLDNRTRSWLDSANDDLKQRFASAGLIHTKKLYTLQELFQLFITKKKAEIVKSTVKVYRENYCRLTNFFGNDRIVSTITRLEFSEFVLNLKKIYADSTVSTTIVIIKSVFAWAIEQELILKSPAAGIKNHRTINTKREHFVTIKEYNQILAQCSQDVRTALALYRIGGLRRQEARLLTWDDVFFDEKKIRVHSPKTQRHGKDQRIIPLFPELEEELRRQPRKGKRVLLQSAIGYYYRHVKMAIERAGLTAWPKLFQNLRMSRATEINRDFGWIPETQWMGHTQSVAQKHYLRVTEEEFNRAVAKSVAFQASKVDQN